MAVTRPEVTKQVVEECITLGIKRVWLHNMLGTRVRWGSGVSRKITSVSNDAVRKAREAGPAVITGSCPIQHVAPVDGWHRCVRWFADNFGNIG